VTRPSSGGIGPGVGQGPEGNVDGMLWGRASESARLDALIADAAAGRGGVVVVRGEPGAGKSALLSDASARAAGARVLRTQGVESESPLAFAALHRLLRPVLPYLDRLPAPQARALRGAFGEQDGSVADRFAVFLATLSLLSEAAEERPVVAVVDDAQWLDAASAEALLFVARRLQADRVALIFAARDGDIRTFHGDGLPELALDGLDSVSAGALLAERAGVPVSAEVCAALVAQTGGSPLALTELPAVLSAGQLAGQTRLPDPLPLTAGVERTFLDRGRRLPPEAQTLLLVAAADGSGQVATVRRAAAALGAGGAALEAAERSGLIQVQGPELRFRHPLVRSAIYGAATLIEQQRVHRILAESLSGDVDRRTWHLALATEGLDDRVAAALDAVAERAERRGGHEAASAAWERAAELTAETGTRARRLENAATSAWLGGQTGRARVLAEDARRYASDPILRSDIDRLRARLEWNVGSGQTGQAIVLRAAQDVAPFDGVRALEMAMLGTTLATFSGGPGLAVDPVTFLPALPDDAPVRLKCCRALVTGQQFLLKGQMRAAAETLRWAFSLDQPLQGDVDLLANLGLAAIHLGDDTVVHRNLAWLRDYGRESAAVSVVVFSQARLPAADVPAGRWDAASASAAEALELARSAGLAPMTALPLAWQVLLAALRGSQDGADALEELERLRARQPIGIVSVVVADVIEWAKGAAAAAISDTDGAMHHLGRLRHPALQRLAALDRLEAASRAGGRTGHIRAWTGELAHFAEDTGAAWAAAIAAHGRALTAADGGTTDPEPHFQEALAEHSRASRPVAQARTQLAYGEFLRRSRRRVDARAQLRAALDVFTAAGALPWADRARQELRASGETARQRDPSASVQLTPQEQQVAYLVSRGNSNADVAAQLFLSRRTVEYHLRNAYQKLGVRSRGDLVRLALS
jgi:DNA-binding CsgD family transcriptional regulator